jgi:protein-S-isoprenylcysteine O-methyltransferase Ste14
MPIAALTLFGLFVLLAGLGRGLIQYRSTRDTGIRRDATGASSISGIGGVLTAVAAPITDLTGLLDPVRQLASSALEGIGITLAVLGITALFAGQLAMGNAWRIGVDPNEQTALVTTGPFRLVRNPIFTAEAIAFAGFALMVPNVIALAGFALVLGGIHYQVRRIEEPHLHRTHGRNYDEYAATVGRFLPGIGRLRTKQN